jgi:hypothetical protein
MKDIAVTSGSRAPVVLELSVNSLSELIDTSRPTCLGKRHLHEDIAAHLLEEVAAAPRHAPVKLNLMLPADEVARATDIATAIRTYFDNCCNDEQRQINAILRNGRIALMIALTLLLLVNGLGASIRATFSGRFAGALADGLEIFGWVAMWKPAELLLYEWVPVLRKKKLLARLATMEIECIKQRGAAAE